MGAMALYKGLLGHALWPPVLHPFLGLAIGAAMGGLMGHFADIGIDDNFIKQVRSQVTEGTSALFLLGTTTAMDKMVEAMKPTSLRLSPPTFQPNRKKSCGPLLLKRIIVTAHNPIQPGYRGPDSPAVRVKLT